ncbi:hypothetical protein E4H12_05435 [Candidatus Thorarchaeota archaeon]|nr:MAG: hypothetical protein E4H12_05435 [Candidatus Thorarchaeota archaeon]
MKLITKLALSIQSRLYGYLNAQATQLRAEQWAELTEAALGEFTEEKQFFAKGLLKNQIDYLETARAAGPSSGSDKFNIPHMDTIMFEVTKHFLKELNVHNIVGVQPMTGPVSLAYGMRYSESEAQPSSDMSFREGKGMKLEVISNAVEAKARFWKALSFSLEAAEDLKRCHVADVDSELVRILATELVHEITTEILNDLSNQAAYTEQIVWEKLDPNDNSGLYLDGNLQRLIIELDRMSTAIAMKTRRGPGNFIVATPLMVSLLQTQKVYAFNSIKNNSNSNKSMALDHVGDLSYKIDQPDDPATAVFKVYSSLCLPPEDDHKETILMGYKGHGGETDTGYFFAPYVPIMPGVVHHDPHTFQPIIPLMTRYGKTTFESEKYLPQSGGSYYGKLTLTDLRFT